MAIQRNDSFNTIRIEGSLLSTDLFKRFVAATEEVPGLTATDYNLASNERLNEAINRSWNRLTALWKAFQKAREQLVETDWGTRLTRDRWLLPLFQELGYGRLTVAKAQEIGGKNYPISHVWNHTPIHLLGCRLSLDRRTAGAAGAATMHPHSMIQEYLNRSDDHLWGIVSNGLILRILRDNSSIARQAYIEFDLEAIMEGELYADFVLLWLICHQSRFEAENPVDCWLEQWCKSVQEDGSRVLEELRNGVMQAINILGRGFLEHPANRDLREALRNGSLEKQDYYRELLRLVYRLIFLCTAEDRNLLFTRDVLEKTRQKYERYYSLKRLRALAEKRRGTQHTDLFQQLKLVMNYLGTPGGCPALGLPALGSFLWSEHALPSLMLCEISNRAFLESLRALTLHQDGMKRTRVDFRRLGAEELGSVYESLLELHPELHIEAHDFQLNEASGNERKTTGSYYTPTSLINCLLDSALNPVLEEAANQKNPEQSVLNLKVCDPACGSGQFLVGAARRIAFRLAAIRSGDDDPTPEHYRTALRDVISHCIYGVDIHDMAVELCKINLWLESLEPGKPLSFLDHHIQCGNSLLGTTPALMAKGIPGDAFEMIEGDKRADVTALKRQNLQESAGQGSLFGQQFESSTDNLSVIFKRIDAVRENQLQDQTDKENRYQEYLASSEYMHQRLLADAWSASFVWIKDRDQFDHAMTQSVFNMLRINPAEVDHRIVKEIERLTQQYRFFHWHLAFPGVFSSTRHEENIINEHTGWAGGFDIILGNPPWERVKLQEKEWFASRIPEIAQAPNAAARQRLISSLADERPEVYHDFLEDKRQAEGESHLVRHSGMFPLCGRGDINTYAIFAELMKSAINPYGRVGCIVPSGIATDDTTKYFFQEIMGKRILGSLFDFENRQRIFTAVDSRMKFCLLTLTGAKRPAQTGAKFCFFAYQVEDLLDQEKVFTMSAEDLELLNPNTRTCPIFRSRRDAELAKSIYHQVPVLVKEGALDGNPWGISFLRMFDMSNDSHLFKTRQELETAGYRLEGNQFIAPDDLKNKQTASDQNNIEVYLPLYEAKMIHHYDHRYGSYRDVASDSSSTQLPTPTLVEYANPDYLPLPRYWVDERQVIAKISDVPRDLARAWLEYEEENMAINLSLWLTGWRLMHKKDLQLSGELQHIINLNEIDIERAQRFAGEFLLSDEEIAEIVNYNDLYLVVDFLVRSRKPQWLMGFRDITNTTNERTTIATIIPAVGVGHTAPLILLPNCLTQKSALLLGNLTSFAFDFFARYKVAGTHMTYFILKQLPIIIPSTYDKILPWSKNQIIATWFLPRILELTYTSVDLAPYAQEFDYDGLAFLWNEERRFLIRCELDAAYFHLYGIKREDLDYIMETFPIVKRKDEAAFGSYRTKEAILKIYDQMKSAIEGGLAYQTPLDPPPGPPEKWPIPDGQPWPVHIHRA